MHIYGPFTGQNHDITMYRQSKLEETIREDGRFDRKLIYGDPAYGKNDIIHSPVGGALRNMSPHDRECNRSMSSVRVSVEWSFGQIINYWAYLDYKKEMQIGKFPVGDMFRVATLLTNCITIYNGGNTNSDFFELAPPTIEDYLRNQA